MSCGSLRTARQLSRAASGALDLRQVAWRAALSNPVSISFEAGRRNLVEAALRLQNPRVFRIQKSTRLALYAVLEMARHPERPMATQGLAARYGVSEHHLAKVLRTLAAAGIARAVRGASGGFLLDREPAQLSVLEVVRALEPAASHEGCSLLDTGAECALKQPCAIHHVMEVVGREAELRLAGVSFADLLRGPKATRTQLLGTAKPRSSKSTS